MTRLVALLAALALAACSETVEPTEEDPCAVYVDSIYGCALLPPPLTDTLIPLPTGGEP